LPITLLKSKLQSSTPFGNANDDDHHSSRMKIVVKLCRIAAKIARFNSINTDITEWKITIFGHDIARLLPLNF